MTETGLLSCVYICSSCR